MFLPIQRVARGSFSVPEWHLFSSSLGGPPKAEAWYAMTTDGEVLTAHFRVVGEPMTVAGAGEGEFYEGLWFADCGEFWLYAPSTGRYLEFNVGPQGAWWAQAFSEPRVRDLATPPPRCSAKGTTVEGGWVTAISTPWEEVWRCLGDPAELLGNVTLVLGGCDQPDTPRNHFHSVADLSLGPLDFHRPDDWLTILVDKDILSS